MFDKLIIDLCFVKNFFMILGNFLEYFFEFRYFNLVYVNFIMYLCYICCYFRKYNVN